MMEVLERLIGLAYDIGALGATDIGAHFYRQRGWLLWRGELSALMPSGVVGTPDEQGGIFVFPAAHELDLEGELTCDFRNGDVW